IQAIVDQRSVKEEREIIEIENALGTTARIHQLVLEEAISGRSEQEIYAKAMEVVYRDGGRLAYNAILTTMGQILHINTYQNHLKQGQMLLCDMGAENAMHYASDITRTYPVNRKFTSRQRDIYKIVLSTLDRAIDLVRPGIQFKDVHRHAAKDIAQGLIDLGLMKGNPDDIVKEGAHALFFPHGLGHMLGLDVHDMEGLGETYVGYNSVTKRSEQFGTSNLRLGRILEENFVITVEPGLYFIPNLIRIWKQEQKFRDFINYEKLEPWMDFGGVRIEDDFLVTREGREILGPSIPKTIEEIESV
ncbi:MAG: M24 family metallopeptidase, partial [Sphaerochaetaceae bacterium]